MKANTVTKTLMTLGDQSKELPHNVQVEQALLGAVLINEQAFDLVSDFLEADHFYEPIHAEFYRLFRMMKAGGIKITPTSMRPWLPEADVSGMTTAQYLARVAANATTVINAPEYARIIFDLHGRRCIVKVAEDMIALARDATPDMPATKQIEIADEGLHLLRREMGVNETTSTTLQDGLDNLIKNTEAVRKGEAPEVPTTGFIDVDKVMGGGYRGGRLVVFAGRPGMGKTVLLAASARRLARQSQGRFGVMISSLEIDSSEMSSRILADELAHTAAPIAYRDLLTGTMDDGTFDRVKDLVARVSNLPIKIDDGSSLSVAQIETRARMQRDRWAAAGIKLGVLFIDYLGLIARPQGNRNGKRVEEIGDIVKGCKELSKKLGICVVLLAQLNRSLESRDDKRPNMSDLRDSGEIEEHADVVGLLYRPAYYLEKKLKSGDPETIDMFAREQFNLELHLAKNRLGPANTVKLYCNVMYSTVDNARNY